MARNYRNNFCSGANLVKHGVTAVMAGYPMTSLETERDGMVEREQVVSVVGEKMQSMMPKVL